MAEALALSMGARPAYRWAIAFKPGLAELHADALLQHLEQRLAVGWALEVVPLAGNGGGQAGTNGQRRPVARIPAMCSPRQALMWEFRARAEPSLYCVGGFLLANLRPDGSLRHEAAGRLACRTWPREQLGRALNILTELRDAGAFETLRAEHLQPCRCAVDLALMEVEGHLVGSVPVSDRVGLAPARACPELEGGVPGEQGPASDVDGKGAVAEVRRAAAFVRAVEERRHTLERIAQSVAAQASPTRGGRSRLGALSLEEVARLAGLECGLLVRICRNKYVRLPGGSTAVCTALFADA